MYPLQLSWLKKSFTCRKLKSGVCDNLEGWDGGGSGREIQGEGDICTPMADSC